MADSKPADALRDLDIFAYSLGLTRTLTDDGRELERITAALKLVAERRSGCGRLDWCNDCMQHIPHGTLTVATAARAGEQ